MMEAYAERFAKKAEAAILSDKGQAIYSALQGMVENDDPMEDVVAHHLKVETSGISIELSPCEMQDAITVDVVIHEPLQNGEQIIYDMDMLDAIYLAYKKIGEKNWDDAKTEVILKHFGEV